MRATDALESLRRRRGAWARRRAAVLHVDLDRGLEPLTVPQGYPSALLIVHQQGAVLGQVLLPARGVIPVEEQWSAIAHRMGAAIWRQRLRRSLAELAAASGPPVPAADPPVAVVVCTRDRTDQLRACLDSLLALRTPAAEILVVDNAPSDDRTRRLLCDGYPVRYVLEPLPGQTRARNRGIVETGAAVVAFTDDDCVVDAGWLDGLGEAFRDPLVMAVTGYTGPLELEHHAQYLFELHGGFDRHPEPVLFDPLKTDPIIGAATAGAGANMMFRREVFRAVGLFAEDLGPGTPARAGDDKNAFYRVLAAGYRIGYDPARIVWHRHRGDWDALRRALEDYGVAEFAFTARALATRRDAGVVQIWRWWARHLVGETRRALTGRPGRMPLALPASEARGWLGGPAGTIRSARSRRGIPPIELPPERPPTAAPAPAPAPSIAVVGEPPPALSVAIASRERAVMLRRILTALAAQDHPADRFEVVVVLDGSTDDSASLARGHEVPFAVRVVEHERRGAAATRNRAAREAEHPVLVFLDDDIVPVPGFLSAHARAHAGAVGDHAAFGYSPPVVDADGLWPITLRAWWADHFRRKTEPGHQWRFTDVLAGNASLPRALFLETGGYDESFGGRREDWEQGIRLLRRGVRLSHLPAAEGAHHLDITFATAVRNARMEGRDDIRLATKHPEVGAGLPFVRVAAAFARRPRRTAAILEGLGRTEPLVPAALAALDALDAARLRRRWQRLAGRVLLRAYVLGLMDAIPDLSELRAFLADVTDAAAAAESLPVWLDRPAGVELRSPVAPAELVIGHAGTPLTALPAVGAGGQWDWRRLLDGGVHAAADPTQLALALHALDDVRAAHDAARLRRETA